MRTRRGRRSIWAPPWAQASIPHWGDRRSGGGTVGHSRDDDSFAQLPDRPTPLPDASPTVLVVDDDSAIRTSIARLLRSVGINCQLFATISDFLAADPPEGPA